MFVAVVVTFSHDTPDAFFTVRYGSRRRSFGGLHRTVLEKAPGVYLRYGVEILRVEYL